jgi:CYTH domain-containing protein
MAKEQERKFELKYLPEGLDSVHIKQGYVMFDGKKHMRVRIMDDYQARLTVKTILSPTERVEYEYDIPLEDALEMYAATDIKLEKTRYFDRFNGNTVDIDVFTDGTMVVEIEYTDAWPIVYLPPYCGKEVTGNKKYSNIAIAKRNAKKARKDT